MQTDFVQAQNTPSLAFSSVSRTGATLTISNHGTAWYYRRSPATLGPCSDEVPANNSAILEGLTPATAYIYKAYSDAACATELTTDSTHADFSTLGLVLSSHDLTVTEGSSATYTVELAAAPTDTVTVTVARATDRYPGLTIDTDSLASGNQSTLTFTAQNWSTAQTVTVAVAANSLDTGDYVAYPLTGILHSANSTDLGYEGASAANAVRVIDATAPVLSASSVTATGATLAVSNHADTVYYRGFATLGTWGTCTAVSRNTTSVSLRNLAPGTEHTYYAYYDSTCRSDTEITTPHTRAHFTTPGVVLSTRRLIAPEDSTATYTVRLATAPVGDVTVTVTSASGGDSDLTVDTDPSMAGDQNTLAFNATNWDSPQSVTVTAAAESGGTDTTNGTATFNHSATSGYPTTAASALTVTEGDDDVCGGTTAVGNATTGGLVDDCNILLAAKAMLAGTSTAIDNWATSLAIASWTGITADTSGVTGIKLGPRHHSSFVPLNGSVPNTLGDLSGVNLLLLDGNSMTGPIPPQLGDLTSRTNVNGHLDLRNNVLSGPIPSELGKMTELAYLGLAGNMLSGTIPHQLGRLDKLQWLHLNDNALSGPIPTQLGGLTHLSELDLSGNELSGPIPTQLAGLGSKNFSPLMKFRLDRNALSGSIPALLGRSNPVELNLGDNALSGAIPAPLASTLSLRQLTLYANSLTGAIPPQLGNLAGLQWLYLGENSFSGPIPAQLGHLTQLTELGLNDNDLSGPVPASLGELESLVGLYLDNNSLSGSIPAELGDLAELVRLWLDRNELSGPIPAELGSLSHLRQLSLFSNGLSGSIPAELGSLTGLDWLYLGDNRLSGCVPANLLSIGAGNTYLGQSNGTSLTVCDGIVLSDAHPSVREGSTATYTVRLSSRPTADVTVAIAASGDSDITVSPASLTFTAGNWSTAQTATLTAADDNDATAGTATITHTATSDDSNYSAVTTTATATEDDDDPSLSALSGPTSALLEISEHSGAWYHKQTAPTPVGSCSTVVAAGTSRAEVTSLKPSTSYTFKAYSDSTCTTANELASATFTTASGVLPFASVVTVPEGSSTPFLVALASQPTGSVTVTVSGDANGDSDLTFDTNFYSNGNQDTLSFSTSNWQTPQSVHVAAADDTDTSDGTQQLTLTTSSTDSNYNNTTATVDAVEIDDDEVLTAAAVRATSAVLSFANHSGDWYLGSGYACTPQGDDHTVSLTGLEPTAQYTFKAYSDVTCLAELTSDATDAEFTTGNLAVFTPESLSVTEGSTASYTVALAIKPKANVTLTLAVTGDSDSDITVRPASLTFTARNWSTAQTVTVSAAQDDDGANGTAAVTHVAASSDADYSGRNIGAVAITEADDDVGLNASDVTGTTATLTLSNHAGAWYYKQTVPTAGTCSAEITAGTATASLDSLTPGVSYTFKAYSNSSCSTVLTADAYDAEFATPLATLSTQAVPVPEGGSATYTIALAGAPSADVAVALAVTGDSDVTVSPASLTFTDQNWSTAQTVTVSAAQDDDSANSTATVAHTSTSNDTTFSAKSLGTVTVTEADDDATLAAESVTSTNATLRISNHIGAWHYKQTAPATGACTAVAAGAATAALATLRPGVRYEFGAYSDAACDTEVTASASRAAFATPGVVLSASRLAVREGSARTYTVRLSTAPSSDVTVTVWKRSGSDGDLRVDTDPDSAGYQTSLRFTTQNWSVPQTVILSAAEEPTTADKVNGTAVFRHTPSSSYTNAFTALTATELDNDSCPGTAAVGGATVIAGPLVRDCHALLAAKAELAVSSTALDDWATTLDMGSWTGVSVSNGRVTGIDLSSRSLDGKLSAALGRLDALTSLNLSSNSLTGEIPAQMGDLTSLTALALHSNSLTGCVPANLTEFIDTANSINPQSGNVNLIGCNGLVISNTQPVVDEGGTLDYTVNLASQPGADVTVTLTAQAGPLAGMAGVSSADSTAGTAGVVMAQTVDGDITIDADPSTNGIQNSMTFTSENWSTAQTVRVIAGEDSDATNGTITVNHVTRSADPDYNGLSAPAQVTENDNERGLIATRVTRTTAVLTITNHTTAWHYKQTTPAGGECSDEIAANTTSTELTGLTAGRQYVFKAYSDAACATELTSDDTDAEFRTLSPAPVGGSPGGGSPGGGGGASSAKSIRVSGATRYSTATAAANRFVTLVEDASAAAGSRQQVDTMIVASGEAFPDALAASALARTLRAPVVLTPRKLLDPAVKSFVTRNRITKVVIVGGSAAVSDDVEAAIKALPGIDSVTRHAGPDRYATAALIAQAAGTPGNLCGSTTPTVIVTTGQNFPDALVAGPLAYRGRHPIVLTAADRLPDATAEYLRTSGAKQAVIVGGPAAVSGAVIDAIKALGLETSRVSGSDRADTSVQFARRFSTFSGPSCYRRDTVGLATGWAFPDALSAAALLGHYGAPLLLTSPDGVPQPLIDYAASGKLEPDFDQPPIVTIGGRNAVPSNHPTKLLAALPR